MQVLVKGSNNRVRLSDTNDFVAAGGEARIFAKKGVAYKIYINPRSMLPFAKIQELSKITDSNVIKPERIVLNTKQKPIGYTMKHISNTYALCQLFPTTFRDRTGLSAEAVLKLIQKMQSTISNIHKHGILLVDINEMNFLTDKSFKEMFFIDVDSYQTPSFPATAIMDCIRDRHTGKFSQLTDWFSFGVISFQLFIGIHPFKGRHPDFKRNDIDGRMKANIPVFNKQVKFPNVCQPFDIIPQTYKDWYKAIFTSKQRFMPPTELVQVVVVPVIVKTVTGNEDFEIKEIFEYNSDVIKFISIDGTRVVIATNDLYINNQKTPQTCSKNVHIGITPVTSKVISATIENNFLSLFNSSDQTVPEHNIMAEDIMSYGGRIYIKNEDVFSEIQFVEMGNNIHAVPKRVANVMEKATKLFDGVVVQNILGSFMASIFPESKIHYQIKCPEFDGYKIVDAKYDKNVLIVIGSKKGKYDKFILKFDDKFSSYSLRKVDDISYCGINFTVLDNGIVIHINENEEIEIFSNKKDANKVKVIDSPVISGDMKLFNDGTQVVFVKGKKLYRLKMKK